MIDYYLARKQRFTLTKLCKIDGGYSGNSG